MITYIYFYIIIEFSWRGGDGVEHKVIITYTTKFPDLSMQL